MQSYTAVPPGTFIVFEGLDRAGKSTQIARVAAVLRQHTPVHIVRYPCRETVTGKQLAALLCADATVQSATQVHELSTTQVHELSATQVHELSATQVHELFARNRWETVEGLEALLAAGSLVLCDRYAYSGVAYSCAKGLERSWCLQHDEGLPMPDLVLYLHIDPVRAAVRTDYGAECYERVDFQRKVALEYARFADAPNWRSINAEQSIEAVTDEILRCIAEFEFTTSKATLW